MTPEQQRRVRDLFEAALDRESSSGAERWVSLEAADDPLVRDEVLSLLAHHSRAGEFLSHPVVDLAPDLLAADDALAPGTVVGTYTIVREIGRGGMGRVYLASDARLGRTVALKALAPHLLRDPAQRERLRREARAAASLTHPGICTVYALEEVGGDLFIASEFVDGHTLRKETESGRRPSSGDVLRTAKELAAALAAAHAIGIVHRDLKPDNVMRTRDGRLKILDFGLARFDLGTSRIDLGTPEGVPYETPYVGRHDAPHVGHRFSGAVTSPPYVTQPGAVIGTPAYMAPEQINGEVVDARADVFAFGVLLYEYACGVHPFDGSTPLAIVARVLESDARPLSVRCPDLSSGLADVIGRCLRKTPAERFGSAVEIVGALKAVDGAADPSPHATWWRTHQLAIVGLDIGGAMLAWQIKEWIETPMTVSIFLALGAAATIGGVLRGHLVFTEWFNRPRLARERLRTRNAARLLDLLTAALLFVDAVIIAGVRALPAVFALSAALGLALASLVLEPATTAAAFGEES